MTRLAHLALAALVTIPLATTHLLAQPVARRTAWELRADAIASGSETVAHAGAGFTLPLGTYARAVFAGGAGSSFADGAGRLSARAEALVRLTTDPFAEERRALGIGAGVAVRGGDRDEASRTDLVLVVGLDGRPRRGWAPALELGLGGGVRMGVALRQIRGNRR